MAENFSPLEAQASAQKPGRFPWSASVLILLLIVAIVGTYIWYSLRSSCEVSAVEEASAILVSQTKSYDNVYQSAINAPQNSVFIPVSVMQQILMDTQEVVVPACMQTVKNELIDYMGIVISAFQAYAAGEADATVGALINQSNEHYSNFFTELKVVKECAPFCIP